MNQIFVDMDGVLADFDLGYHIAFGIRPSKADNNVDWQAVRNCEGFYRDLPPMHDFDILWNGVLERHPDPIILTGVPKSVEEAADNKRAWVDKHLGKGVKMIATQSSKKSHFITKPGDILIDDWEKYKNLWIKRGGRWITHISANVSLYYLERYWVESHA